MLFPSHTELREIRLCSMQSLCPLLSLFIAVLLSCLSFPPVPFSPTFLCQITEKREIPLSCSLILSAAPFKVLFLFVLTEMPWGSSVDCWVNAASHFLCAISNFKFEFYFCMWINKCSLEWCEVFDLFFHCFHVSKNVALQLGWKKLQLSADCMFQMQMQMPYSLVFN